MRLCLRHRPELVEGRMVITPWFDKLTTGESFTREAIFLPRLRDRCRLTMTYTTEPSVPSVIFFLAKANFVLKRCV